MDVRPPFHAFLFAPDGTLIDQRQQARGVNHVTDGAFEAALREIGRGLGGARRAASTSPA